MGIVNEITADLLRPGMLVKGKHGKRGIKVESVEIGPRGCRTKVHVNKSLCFERFAVLEVRAMSDGLLERISS